MAVNLLFRGARHPRPHEAMKLARDQRKRAALIRFRLYSMYFADFRQWQWERLYCAPPISIRRPSLVRRANLAASRVLYHDLAPF